MPGEHCKQAENLYKPNEGTPLEDWIEQLPQLSNVNLIAEYNALKKLDPVKPSTGSSANPMKNRYPDIPCFDFNRVVIANRPNKDDYIHANFVDGFKHKKAFISTQGPTPKTIIDFWDMTWQENVFVIVSLTKIIEGGKEKCSKYWPTEEGKATQFKDIKVTNCEIENRDIYDVTLLRVKNVKTNETRNIYHMLYLAWPDFSIPDSSLEFHTFLDEVNNIQQYAVSQMNQWNGCPDGPPIVVHCSAGIGRTGTFIAMDICRKKLMETRVIEIKETVRLVRLQRALAVQRPEQYVFVYLAMIEFAVHYMQCRKKFCFDYVNFLDPQNKIKYTKTAQHHESVRAARPVSKYKPKKVAESDANDDEHNATEQPTNNLTTCAATTIGLYPDESTLAKKLSVQSKMHTTCKLKSPQSIMQSDMSTSTTTTPTTIMQEDKDCVPKRAKLLTKSKISYDSKRS